MRVLAGVLGCCLFAMSAAGCVIFKPTATGDTVTSTDTVSTDSGDSGTTDSDSGGTDSDSGGTDSDSGTVDTDTGGTDTDSGGTDSGDALVDCNDPPDAREPLDACVTDEIHCGDTIVDTIRGGTDVLSGDDYKAWYCTTDTGFDGTERIYDFEHPGGNVTFTLDSPCGDLYMFDIRWEYYSEDGTCPTDGDSILECDVEDTDGGGDLNVYQTVAGKHYLIAIDSPTGEEPPFALTVTCE